MGKWRSFFSLIAAFMQFADSQILLFLSFVYSFLIDRSFEDGTSSVFVVTKLICSGF